MAPTSTPPLESLGQLEQQCRYLESRCAEYVRTLEKMNRELANEIARRKKAEETIQQAYSRLEDIVTDRTRQIRKLKDRLHAENVILRHDLAESQAYGTIIGKSQPIQTVIEQIERVAPTDASVLIHGESGTGKELVAREIHKHSQRKNKPLIKVNCATIPKDLYESEFFGHIRGAFTGAIKDRIGRFEAADGGTIFLDEVGEIPLNLQSKLLRVIQEGQYERVGEDKTRTVDVRIIAATNKNLEAEVGTKRFRDDLFYRLNVFPIEVAPLRERKGDIPLLTQHFVNLLCKQLNLPCPRLTQANIMDLTSYHWPGNVRELENAIERGIILNRSGDLDFSHLGPTFQSANHARSNDPPDFDLRIETDKVLTENELKQLERQNTINALTACRWKIYGKDGAAQMLTINPTTLIERMKRMRIKKPQNLPPAPH